MNNTFWKDKTVLVTGHTGFKGSWLSLWLQELGANLIGYSKDIPTKPSLFELADVKQGMISIIGDICDYDKLDTTIIVYNPEIIIHMAAQSLVQQSYEDPIETFSSNIIGTANLLQIAKARVVINVTSDKCYAPQSLVRGYNEQDVLGGNDPYSCSKACSELITSSFRTFKHYSLASVRAGNTIGGGDWGKERLVTDIINGILNKTTIEIRNPFAVRPWQFVLDPLRGYLILAEKLWEHGSQYAEAWNFGPDIKDSRTVSWVLQKLIKLWGSNTQWIISKKNYGRETDFLGLDSTKSKTRLGWYPTTDLETTLKLIVDWYKEYPHNIRETTLEQIRAFNSLEVKV